MGSYVPVTPEERRAMLERIGLPSVEALYADVPEGVLLKEPPVFTGGFSELEVRRHMERLAEQNRVFSTILRGAGAYDHYIPAIVRAIPSKEAFLTAYTPYQAEISQGLLQSIFEYQTMICRLTGMDVANASVYDGASAAAEACAMVRERRRTVTLVSACAHPDVIATIRTYCWGSNHEMRLIPEKDGVTDLDALRGALDDQVSGVYLASPNFLGGIEDVSAAAEICHAAGAQAVLNANYLMCLLRDGGYPMAYDHPCMHEFVITLEKLKHEKDVSALDVAKALLDHGMHPPTMYFPLIVHEALMVEPTETESKESLEAAAESYLAVLAEANENPADMHNRPLTTYVRRLDEVTAARNPIVKYEAPSA